MNANPALLSLSDIASQAHEKIQQDFENINPVIGVIQGMRKTGIPADVSIFQLKNESKMVKNQDHSGCILLIKYFTKQLLSFF